MKRGSWDEGLTLFPGSMGLGAPYLPCSLKETVFGEGKKTALFAVASLALGLQTQPTLPDSWSVWREAVKSHTVPEITQGTRCRNFP